MFTTVLGHFVTYGDSPAITLESSLEQAKPEHPGAYSTYAVFSIQESIAVDQP